MLTVDAIVVLPRERGAEASQPQKLRALEFMIAWLTCAGAGAGSHLSVPQRAFGLAKARKRREMLYCDIPAVAPGARFARDLHAVPPVAPRSARWIQNRRAQLPGPQ